MLQFLRQSAQKPTRHLSIESRGPCFSLSMKFRGLARVNERAARLKRYLQITKALSEDALGAIKLLFDDRKTEANGRMSHASLPRASRTNLCRAVS